MIPIRKIGPAGHTGERQNSWESFYALRMPKRLANFRAIARILVHAMIYGKKRENWEGSQTVYEFPE